MTARLAALAVGVVFGLVLCWSRMADPDVIRSALLLEQSYLYLFFASAVVVAALGGELVRRRRRALLADVPVGWSRQRPQRRHFVGALVFGVGWAVADACPGPIATQIGQAIPWALATMAGVVLGIVLFQRGGTGETEPALDEVEAMNAFFQGDGIGRNDRAPVEAGRR